MLSPRLKLPGGAPFPARDLAVLLAMGVIVVSTVAASIGLPPLLKGLAAPADPSFEAEEARARAAAAHAAIAAIERLEKQRSDHQPDSNIAIAAAARVIGTYRARFDSRAGHAEAAALAWRGNAIEHEMRLAGIRAERNDVFHDLRARKLGSETARKLIRELDLLEARLLA